MQGGCDVRMREREYPPCGVIKAANQTLNAVFKGPLPEENVFKRGCTHPVVSDGPFRPSDTE